MGFIPTETDFMTVEELRKDIGWPLDYTASKGLIPYIKRMKGTEVAGIEIGAARGESAYYILEQCPNVSKLITIDPFLKYEDWNGPIDQPTMDRFKTIAYKNLEVFDSRAEIVNMTAEDAKDMFPDFSYQFIFIDGDHSTKGVLQDLNNYYPKLAVGGLLAVHDTNLNSVTDAIKGFREINKVRNPINRIINSVAFWTK